jgi:hypothetical protein
MSDASPRAESPVAPDPDVIRARAEACQKLVDDAASGSISGPIFLERLRDTGVTPDEAKDYISQLSNRRSIQGTANTANTGGQPPVQPTVPAPNPLDAATAVAWALLRAKVDHIQPSTSQPASLPGGSLLDEIACRGAARYGQYVLVDYGSCQYITGNIYL